MSKQIKLGFDKNISRETEADQILVDVRGNLLRDSTGDFLYTESIGIPSAFFRASNSTSIYINNEISPSTIEGGSISVVEQFPEVSEVSSSLLGIPRLGKQQSLLADVSIYGLDSNTWEFYNNPNPFQPQEWITRFNTNYGQRYNARLKEYPGEQALALEIFPTPWTFPFGPNWGVGRYNALLFGRYRNFIQLGNDLYDFYRLNGHPEFARKNFLPRSSEGGANILGTGPNADVEYNSDFRRSLAFIENWTMAWMDIRDGARLDDPLNPGRKLNSIRIRDIFGIENFSVTTQPGYSSTTYRYCQLQSKEAFRYQPGAISGFTFGVRLNSDPASTVNVLEWGCANDTDQFMFQVKGSQFNIVRRSTVPLTRKNLELMGLTLEDQRIVNAPNPFERADTSFLTTDLGLPPQESRPLYETVIENDIFNGDPLNGSGRSQYNISFNEVTMYKIEYSWYGAIGAKFYAYIPVGNDDARWVLLHTFVVENTLDNPSMQNPFMHFRYSIYLNDTSSLREPVYLYKYGASYYIDGSDEGTFSYNSYKLSQEKSITSTNSKPVIGFLPKDTIKNKDGIPTKSQKNFYIDKVSVSTDKNCRVDLLECEGCPGGHGFFYATSLRNGQKGVTGDFVITETGELQYQDPTEEFASNSSGKKLIAPGVYSAYVFVKENQIGPITSLDILRRSSTERINTPINASIQSADKTSVGGIDIDLLGYQFSGRLTGYGDLIASDIPITKSNIKIQFLNPIAQESSGQWAEFRIGLTDKKPELIIPEGESNEVLLFDDEPLDIESELYGEFSQWQARKNLNGVETGEFDPRYGNIMTQDPRVSRPSGVSSGDCSELNFQISTLLVANVEYSTTDPSGELSGSNFIIFKTLPPTENLEGGEVGIFDGNQFTGSGILFTSNLKSFTFVNEQSQLETNYVAAISGSLEGITTIALKVVRCFGRFINKTKVFTFSAKELYLFIAMRDNAVVNNIVVREFDEVSSFSHTPNWIKDSTCNIEVLQIENATPPASVTDKLTTSNEYIGLDGRFYMGGTTFTGNVPSNFTEKTRLDSVQSDNQLSLPLRPSSIKTSFYIGANKSETLDMKHIFGINKYKITKGSFNNKAFYFSSIVSDPNETGSIFLNISGKEQ